LINAQRYCNGYESYCDKGYDELVYATAHNSYAVGKSYSANQENSIEQQLFDGIRGVMLDLVYHDDGSVHFCHTRCDKFLDAGQAVDVLSIFTNFIEQNPSEVITIFFENFSKVPASSVNEIFVNSGLINYVYTPSYAGVWPTLGEMIDNRQNVVVFTDELDDPASYPWYLNLNQYVSYNYYKSLNTEEWNCDVREGYGSLFLLYHMKHVQVLGSTGYLPDTTIVDKTNSIEGINEHTMLCPQKINFIAVDYYNHGDIVEYVTRLNGEYYESRKKPVGFASGGQMLHCSKGFIIAISLLLSLFLL